MRATSIPPEDSAPNDHHLHTATLRSKAPTQELLETTSNSQQMAANRPWNHAPGSSEVAAALENKELLVHSRCSINVK